MIHYNVTILNSILCYVFIELCFLKLQNINMKTTHIDYRSKVGFSFRHYHTSVYELKERASNVSHSHPQYEVYYLVSGDVYYHIAGQTYHVCKGDVLLLNAFTSHSLEVLPSEDYERYVVEFDINNIPSLNGITPIADFFNSHSPIMFLQKEMVDQSNIVLTLKRMESLVNNANKYTNHYLLSYIINLVTQIAEKLEEAEGLQTLSTLETTSSEIYINKATQYISANISNKITINDIANNVHLSRSYLQHLFKEVVGTSISDYIFYQKMYAANFMLTNGKSLQETATALGYSYYSTFSMQYKKLFKKPPKSTIK